MLSIAIKDENSHFEHGLKIIITRLTNQWRQETCLSTISIVQTSPFYRWMKSGSARAVTKFPATPVTSIGSLFAANAIKIS